MSPSKRQSSLTLRSIAPISALVLVGISLTGCLSSAEYASPDPAVYADYHKRYPIVLAEAPTTVEVYPVGGRIDDVTRGNIREFVDRYRKLGSGSVSILAPADQQRVGSALSEIRKSLYALGLRGKVYVGSYPVADTGRVHPVRLVYQGVVAQVPGHCGEWRADLASGGSLETWKNESAANFACAYQSTLAAELDDPRDIVRSRPSDPPDVEMRMRAIDDVRKGADPGTAWKIQNTTIGAIGG